MLSRLARLLALAALFASVICTVEASSHPFSDPPPTQKEANASAVAARPPLPKCSSAASKCVLTTPAGGSGSGGDEGGGGDGGKGSSEETRRAQPPIESEKTPGDYASFVVNAGSEVEVALFDVVGRSSGPEAPSA